MSVKMKAGPERRYFRPAYFVSADNIHTGHACEASALNLIPGDCLPSA